jgi:hypothetical protein
MTTAETGTEAKATTLLKALVDVWHPNGNRPMNRGRFETTMAEAVHFCLQFYPGAVHPYANSPAVEPSFRFDGGKEAQKPEEIVGSGISGNMDAMVRILAERAHAAGQGKVVSGTPTPPVHAAPPPADAAPDRVQQMEGALLQMGNALGEIMTRLDGLSPAAAPESSPSEAPAPEHAEVAALIEEAKAAKLIPPSPSKAKQKEFTKKLESGRPAADAASEVWPGYLPE